MHARWSRVRSRLLRGSALVIALGVLAWVTMPRCTLYPDGTTWSRQVLDRHGSVLSLTLSKDGKYRLLVPLQRINPDAIDATLTHEDQHFYSHPGVNPFSLIRGFGGWITGAKRGGGSTISMQYARLRFGLNTRSVFGKAWQMVRALQIERHYSKDQILEAYLNMAPYGGNVEGIGAASILWCGKQAHDLTLREAVTLSVLPQSPTSRKPRANADNQQLAAAQSRLIHKLQAARGLRSDPLEESFTLRAQLTPPRAAPHLSRRLLDEHEGQASVTSTIDADKQNVIERSLADYISRKHEIGIHNACALLVHAPTHQVLGYVGSARFLDGDILGQVDGVTARRSPGSALKPFIYALALEQGLIHPRSLLNDAKQSFGSYNPENFDRGFAGPLPASEALFRSRNIPAVALAQKLAAPGLYGFLKQAGVAFPQPASFYGLALPLGGAEVSMEELAMLYTMLANQGQIARLELSKERPDSALSAPDAKLSPEACYLVREMLRTTDVGLGADDPAVSWKTGTSHGFRDAWAAGIRGEYVLVVWIGNFNGKPNPAFVARECAAPLLFETFQRLALPYHKAKLPAGVKEIELCAVSGQLPTPLCQHRIRGGFIPGISPIQPCQIHQEILMDPAGGLRIANDDGRPGLRREVYECWPPDMLALFRQAGLPRREPPPFDTRANAVLTRDNGNPPRIASPREALVYHVRTHQADQRRIPLRADTAPGVHKVYWFAGAQFLGASPPAEALLWEAVAGKSTLHVMDDHGRSASCQVQVEVVE